MTDGDAAKLARIDNWNWKIWQAMAEIQEHHPNGEAMHERLVDQGFGAPSTAEHVVHENFLKPDDWLTDGFRLIHRVAQRAAETRRRGR